MEGSERRMFLRNSGLAITAAVLGDLSVSNSASTQAVNAEAPIPSEGPKGLTRQLAKFIVSTRFDDIPETVRHEARTLLNWIGCAVGGCHEDTVNNVVTALAPFTGSGQATLFGRTERMDILNAAWGQRQLCGKVRPQRTARARALPAGPGPGQDPGVTTAGSGRAILPRQDTAAKGGPDEHLPSTARVHHVPRRRGGLAARGARAAGYAHAARRHAHRERRKRS